MKAAVAQQQNLLELAELDAELGRLDHRSAHLPERAEADRLTDDHVAAEDRLGALRLAIEDLDSEVARFEADIDGVRQREDRDRRLLDSGTIDAKQLTDLQHELDTLHRRRESLEDSLLEVMERREELQTQQTSEAATVAGLSADLDAARRALEEAQTAIAATREQRSARRDELAAAIDTALMELYERQRGRNGVGAGQLLGGRCGACRIEIDRGELARISAAADDDVLRCPECGAILLRIKGAPA
ncbi:hypothetical protein H7J07_14005 [Mycobacterium koreense]|uniref:C4-type zinc ribbon domain-containing protein n=1 Tax=Mycolicibacillus koreensis TaxID=1069220 RepID=A0A7I7SB75_9MYCO|nr:C4-type zinc ribbon domain-containing protein [Mycolicibacillus koreensis]MCV7249323.1 hypothetical protein [Mycolicibacillus koreensis]ODR10176.1 hypothetical protein BHQ15_04990 [Mycolicibacillus koreensis]OSC35532.1 hypothetical protein B8W67_02065 [Mycolicibacillus koreensis]BBY53235.1 hypothetical protein MKOR_04860 [Mycolicibacillus koreensis]